MKIDREIQVINKLGLHARASAQLVKLATTYRSDVRLVRGNQSVDGKNIMGVMMLAAACGTQITVSAIGDDADEVVDKISTLFSSRFGEQE
jgi:phosphocarrier protein